MDHVEANLKTARIGGGKGGGVGNQREKMERIIKKENLPFRKGLQTKIENTGRKLMLRKTTSTITITTTRK